MLDETGARLQEGLRKKPAMAGMRAFPYPLQGIIKKVYFQDSGDNPLKQTVVDIILFGGYSELSKVPLMAAKVNKDAGIEWSPEEGDFVIVMFINGMWTSPIVTGYCNPPSNEIMATEAQIPKGKRRYHMRCNKTDIVIDKDGNRTAYVNGNETVKIKNSEIVTVETGDITVEVAQGKCTVHIKGKTAWTSDGTIEWDGGSGSPKGVVQGDSVCAYTGKPHPHISATVKASK
jgi:hypothetical protein